MLTWPVNGLVYRRLSSIGPVNDGTGTPQIALSLAFEESAVPGTATVFLVGPRKNCLSDAAGNYLAGVEKNTLFDPMAVPVAVTLPLSIGSCAKVACSTQEPYICTCDDYPSPPAPFPPQLPGGGWANDPNVTDGMSRSSGSSLVPPIIGVVLGVVALLILLYLLYRYCHQRRQLARKRRLQTRLEELQNLQAATALGTDGFEGMVGHLLREVVEKASRVRRPLPEIAQDVLARWQTDGLSTLDGGILVDPLRMALDAGSALALVRLGSQATATDREALEMLQLVLNEATSSKLEPGFDGGGGVRLRPPVLLPAGESRRGWINRPIIDMEHIRPELVRPLLAAVDMGRPDEDTLDQLDELRRRLESYNILPATIAGALMAEHSSLYMTDHLAATEREQVDLLSMLLRGCVTADRPLPDGVAGNGGVSVRPPRLVGPDGEQASDPRVVSVLPVNIERDTFAWVRPPPLLPIDPHQGQNVGMRELHELLRIGLESKHHPFLDSDLGGGVKVRPPMLKPALRQGQPIGPTLVNEDTGLVDGWNGGGGVNVHPPKLLSALIGGQGALDAPNYSTGESQPTMTDLDLHRVMPSIQNAPLDAGWDGHGGARVPPPKLHVPQHLHAAIGFGLTHGDLLDIIRGDGVETLPNATSLTHALALDDLRSLQLQESEFPNVDVSRKPVETQELMAGTDGGGGIRLPPPKLLPMGGMSNLTRAEEVRFLQDLGLDVDAIADAVSDGTAKTYEEHTGRGVQMMELDDEQAVVACAPVEIDELALGWAGSGGVRLKPPRLAAVGLTSAVAMSEEIRFLQDLGIESNTILESLNLRDSRDLYVRPHLNGLVEEAESANGALADGRTSSFSAVSRDSAAFENIIHLMPLLVASLPMGWDGGGGARLAPPKLLSVGGLSSIANAEEVRFMRAMGADEATVDQTLSLRDGVHDTDFAPQASVQQGEREKPELQRAASLLSSAPLAFGDKAGGGVRLPPPRLKAVGMQSMAAKAESIEFMHEMGVDVLRANERMEARRASLEARRGMSEANIGASVRLVELDPPQQLTKTLSFEAAATNTLEPSHPFPMLTRNSTREVLAPARGSVVDSPAARRSIIVQRTSSWKDVDPGFVPPRAAPLLGETPQLPVTTPPRLPPAPARDAKTITLLDLQEGWHGGGGVRIAPGLLGAAGGAFKMAGHRRGPMALAQSARRLAAPAETSARRLMAEVEASALRHVMPTANSVTSPPPSPPQIDLPLPRRSAPTLDHVGLTISPRALPLKIARARQQSSHLVLAAPGPPWETSSRFILATQTGTEQLSRNARVAGPARPSNLSQPSQRLGIAPPARRNTQFLSADAHQDVSDDEEDIYDDDVPPLPPHTWAALLAEAKRSRCSDDALQLARDLVDMYERSNGSIPLSHDQGPDVVSKSTVEGEEATRKRGVAGAFSDAFDSLTRDDRVVGKNGELDANLKRAISELEEEIENIDTALCPRSVCCVTKRKWRFASSRATRHGRGKVAPVLEPPWMNRKQAHSTRAYGSVRALNASKMETSMRSHSYGAALSNAKIDPALEPAQHHQTAKVLANPD